VRARLAVSPVATGAVAAAIKVGERFFFTALTARFPIGLAAYWLVHLSAIRHGKK
jgi:hypothetical protein